MKFAAKGLLLAALLPIQAYAFQAGPFQAGDDEVPCRVAVSNAAQSDGVDIATGLLKRNTTVQTGTVTPTKPFPASVSTRCHLLDSLFVQTAALRHATASVVRRPKGRWVLGDFNNDGRTDSIVLGGNGFTRQLALSTGGSESPVSVTLGAPNHLYASGATADVNGDGRLDLILCCAGSGGQSRLVVSLGNGNGTFQTPAESIPANGRFDLVDWSGDGRPDVVTLTEEGALNVGYGQPNGTFVINHSTLGATDHTVIAADSNNDGFLDAITLGGAVVRVFFGGPSGALGLSNLTPLPIQGASNIVAADYTGDGFLDLAVSEPFGATVLLVGTGGGNFTPTRIFSTGNFDVPDAAEFEDSGRMALLLPDASAPSLQVVPFSTAGVPLASPFYRLSAPAADIPVYDTQRSTVAVADFNGDGKSDLVLFASVRSEGYLQVFRGGPLLSLAAQSRILISPVNAPTVSVLKMLPGDFNNDGRADLILMESESQRMMVYLTTPLTGEFEAPTTTFLTGQPRDFVLGDFNNDGKLDIAVATGSIIPGAGRISVYNGVGNGAFLAPQAIPIPSNITPHRLAVADFNGDFKQDIAYILLASAGTANAAGFALNRTNNIFLPPTALTLPAHSGIGQDPTIDAIATTDLNSDGSVDILIAAPFVTGGPLLVFQGNGAGSFTAKPQIAIAPKVGMMTVLDADEDGNPDLLASHCCLDTTTSIYYGRPDGTLSNRHVIPTGAHTGRIALGDVNGDGKPDLVAHTRAGVTVQPLFLPTEGDVVSAASGLGPTVAIDAIASFYGSGLADAAESGLSEEIRGTRVYVTDGNGKRGAAPLFFVSPGLVNFVTPPGLAEGPGTVTVVPAQGTASTAEITLARVAPGIFLADTTRLVAANVLYVKPNGQVVADLPYRPQGVSLVPVPIDLSSDTVVLVLYGTGIRGRTSLNQVSVAIGGVAATVAYAGAQGSYPGFDQLNVTIPRSLIGRGSVDIALTVEGKASNVGRVVIK